MNHIIKYFSVFLLFMPLISNIGPEGFKQFAYNKIFVETGSYIGDGIQRALDAGFTQIYSLEIDNRFYNYCMNRFTGNNRVKVFCGNAKYDLWQVIEYIDAPITFWLDGHHCPPRAEADNCPLLYELAQIARHHIKCHTIVIDDLHCCGTELFDGLTEADLKEAILNINSEYTFRYIDGGDNGEYPCNILVAEVTNLITPDMSKRLFDKHEEVFTDIYARGVWGKNDQGEPFSGGGSLLKNCINYNSFIEKFIKDHGIISVVDAGCGDWESTWAIDWSGIEYYGCDVVNSVIERNNKRHKKDNIHFIKANIVYDRLPKADLLLCKQVLQHLPNSDIQYFLQHQVPHYKYCIILNQVHKDFSGDNNDIFIGGGHKVDLTKFPFCVVPTQIYNYYITNGDAMQLLVIKN